MPIVLLPRWPHSSVPCVIFMRTVWEACAAAVLSCVVPLAAAADGLVAVKSPHSAQVITGKLESVVEETGLNVFARIDHATSAAKEGETLRPTAAAVAP